MTSSSPPGRVEAAVRETLSPGERLPTPSGRGEFTVARFTDAAMVLLLGQKEAWTAVPWAALEDAADYLEGRGWIRVGGKHNTRPDDGTLDARLKFFVPRTIAGWVAVVLELAGVVELDRHRPARVRLATAPATGDSTFA